MCFKLFGLSQLLNDDSSTQHKSYFLQTSELVPKNAFTYIHWLGSKRCTREYIWSGYICIYSKLLYRNRQTLYTKAAELNFVAPTSSYTEVLVRLLLSSVYHLIIPPTYIKGTLNVSVVFFQSLVHNRQLITYSCMCQVMFRASCLMLEIKEYEAKIEESEKASRHRESNQGHLWLEPPLLCHWATTTGQPPTLTIFYMYCTGGTECLSHTPGSHSACTVRTLLGVNRKILSI